MKTEDISVQAIATKLSRGVPGCPITRGKKTRMLEKSFRRMCAKHRDQPDGYCKDVCRGKMLPENLEFITIEQMEEEGMGVQWKSGVCELCKGKKSVRNNNGKMSCASCEPVWRCVSNRPELVFEMLREKLGDAWCIGRTGSGVDEVASVEDLEAELQKKTNEIDALRDENTKLREQLVANENQKCEVCTEEHNAEIAELEARIEQATSQACNLCADRDRTIQRDTIVLDLALRVLSGEVGGLSVDHLQALR